MTKSPSFQFYPGDWLRNDVSGCSLEAQGLWLRMMMVMHDAQIYGQLVLNNEPMSAQFIAKKVGITPKKYLNLLKELDAAGVINRKENGVIYSGRMERDERARQSNRARQTKHRTGQKDGKKDSQSQNKAKDNGKVTPMSGSSSSSSSSSSSNNTAITSVIAVGDKAKKARGSRLPEVYELTDEMIDYAKVSAPDISVALEHEKFCNYWHAKSGRDATKIDWAATWRNWMLNAQQWTGSKKEHTNGTSKRAGNEAVLDDAARYYQEWERTGVQPPN